MTVSTERSTSRAFEVRSEVERLGRGDEDVGRIAGEPGALRGGRVAGPHRDRGDPVHVAAGRGDVRDPGERRAQVALDVHRERLEGET